MTFPSKGVIVKDVVGRGDTHHLADSPSAALSRSPRPNNVLIWLDLLAKAPKSKLDTVIAIYSTRPQTPNCPSAVLYGQAESDRLYTDPYYRPALDAWDVGKITAYDIVRWSKELRDGNGTLKRNR